MKKGFTLLISLSLFYFLFAQLPDVSDSIRKEEQCNLRVSLLTCTPGTELYSTFGHSAVRATDSAGIDIIFNYGTFDFDDPAFLPKFVRGKLLYFVSIDEYKNFLDQYAYEKRGITEQVLDLSCAIKKKLLIALHDNAKEENRYYKYDFVYDNCTTRLRDIIFSTVNNEVEAKNIRPKEEITFRNLIHEYLDNGHHYWSRLGIDILLGSPLDKKLTNSEAMFLPDYLLKAFDSTTLYGKPLVIKKNTLLKSTMRVSKAPLFSPFWVFTILFLFIFILTCVHGIFRIKKLKRFFTIFDFILFFLSGIFGVLLLFMWLGTDHQACRNNFNLIWAFPVHLIIVFYLFNKRGWLPYYFLANAILLLLLLIAWKWLPQEMNIALLPVVGLMMLRSFMIFKKGASPERSS
ncbi:MAG: lipoprotein N-acyltransferase Lnb domain-containing protein [Chitinophagaceae bacterium]